MKLPIYTYGMSVLRKEAEDITADYPNLSQLVEDMFETMYASDGVGLAAPQIGLPIRLVVISLDVLKDEYPEYAGFARAYANAHILEYDDSKTTTSEEGCLSLPGIHESVRRPARVRVAWTDPATFEQHEEWVEGYLARVMQHEFDHLDGKIFTDRLSPLRKQMVRGKLAALLKGKFRCSYKVKSPK